MSLTRIDLTISDCVLDLCPRGGCVVVPTLGLPMIRACGISALIVTYRAKVALTEDWYIPRVARLSTTSACHSFTSQKYLLDRLKEILLTTSPATY